MIDSIANSRDDAARFARLLFATLRSLHRWTGFAVVAPRRYCDPVAAASLDIHAWSREFTWRRDDFDGWLDVVRPVSETIDAEAGDCEDYAFVVASWALAHDTPVDLAVCCTGWRPAHVVAVTGTGVGLDTGPARVWSSGDVHEATLPAYVRRSDYDRALRLRV